MMDSTQEIDLAGTKPRAGSEPNIVPEMDATSRKDSVDDASKIETASATRVMSDVDTPIRKLQRKPHVNRQRRHPVTTSASKYDTSGKKLEQNVDETESDSDGDSEGLSIAVNSSAIEQAVEEATKTETTKPTEEGSSSAEGVSLIKEKVSSTLESEKPKLDRASAKDGRWKEEELPRISKKKAKDSLKSFIERKIGLMERIVEDRVERISNRIREENVERHPWLQPIDTWITDHRKPTSSYTLVTPHSQEDDERDVASKSTYNCETIEEDEEPRADDKTAEHPRPPRGTSSPRSNRVELANLIAQSKKQKVVPTLRVEYREENVSINVSNDSTGVGEARETKRHNNDLLDKLKDNVKEKMEDIHRVVIQAYAPLHIFPPWLRPNVFITVYHG